MTNREKLQSLSGKEFAEEFAHLAQHPFLSYIDLYKYFEGEDAQLEKYFKCKEYALVPPTEFELVSVCGDGDRVGYIKEHSKKMPVLKRGGQYTIVADLDRNLVIKVRTNSVTFLRGVSE